MNSSVKHTALWFLAIVATFFFLDCFSLHTGDDLGYMFADTRHHCGDGVRVTTLWQCFSTQAHHYVTTNGRYVVHVIVMILLNLAPLWFFRLLNALMFGMLWLLSTRFVVAERRTVTLYAVAWLLLFVALPQPGVVLLTLVSYAVNYLWVGVASLALLLWLQRNPNSRWLLVYAFFVGTLQESYSLPLCAGLFVAALCRRVPWTVVGFFIVGTAVEVFAPGNMNHASQGGGFALTAIAHKASALAKDLTVSIIPYAAALALILYIRRRNVCIAFFKQHLELSVSIVAALLLATLTFTSPRQLTAPTLFTIILLLQLVPSRSWLTASAVAALAVVMTTMGTYKYQIYMRYQSLIDCLQKNYAYAYPQGEPPCTENNALTRAFLPDPLCNRDLVSVGDKYTKRGLQRLRNGESLTSILPYTPKYIAAHTLHQPIDTMSCIVPTSRVGAFDVVAIPMPIYRTHKIAPRVPYEVITHADTAYLVLANSAETVKLSVR